MRWVVWPGVQLIHEVCKKNLTPSLYVASAGNTFKLSKLALEMCYGNNDWAVTYKCKKNIILMLQLRPLQRTEAK